MKQLLLLLLLALFLFAATAALATTTTTPPPTLPPTCQLTPGEWSSIKSAYVERNHYNPMRPLCNTTFPATALQTKYGSCQLPFKTVLADQGYESNCQQYFANTLWIGESATKQTNAQLATKLCDAPLSETVRDQLCNALSVIGCPRKNEILKFLPYASCYGVPLMNKTREQQLDYYGRKEDLTCMRKTGVCESYRDYGWDSCPLDVKDVFYFLDDTHAKYTCEIIYPSAEERCDVTMVTAFYEFCPPPTELEKNLPVIVAMCVIGPCVLVLLACMLRSFMRKPDDHHISRRQILNQAVANFVSFDQPLHAHPEFQTVLAESKFKGVVFDKNTNTWGVLGETKRFANEKEAAQRAYLIQARNNSNLNYGGGAHPPTPNRPKNSEMSSTASNTNVRDFTSMEIPNNTNNGGGGGGDGEYVVNATPLTPQQRDDLRFRQLVAFYEFWEPEKPDIEEHSRNLLTRHDFDHVVRALKTKYGVCPPSWDTFNDV